MSHDDRDQNPYASPTTSSTEPKVVETSRIRPLAVFIGWVVDVGITMAISIVLGVCAAVILVAEKVPPDQFTERMMEMTWLNVLGVVGGVLGSACGGFAAAWMGKSRPLGHGIAVGIASLVTGMVPALAFPEMQPLWVTLSAGLLTLPAAALGGYLRGSTRRAS